MALHLALLMLYELVHERRMLGLASKVFGLLESSKFEAGFVQRISSTHVQQAWALARRFFSCHLCTFLFMGTKTPCPCKGDSAGNASDIAFDT